ncbi:MAG: FAD-dependent oxidoreductase [Oscillospiraceae bacterium]|jgi:2,4-dienoyl-CoA reductase-like NADH-dependent reductase (Old Yellow Enzyme family)/thioredoxin reductase
MSNFPSLTSQFTIKNVTYKNRMFAAPMGRCPLSNDEHMPQFIVDELHRKALGGWAEVAIGETPVDYVYGSRFPEPPLDYRNYAGIAFADARRCAEAIRSGGAVAAIELSHCGAEKAHCPGPGQTAIGPCGYIREDGVNVLEMDEAMMEAVCRQFADAAEFFMKAGFQTIIPNFGHGWLLHQFLSPRTNRRKDGYGGRLENRAKFPLAVLARIRERCGRDVILEVRVSGTEMTQGGITPEETAEFCRMMKGLADIVHVSSGVYQNSVLTNMFSPAYAEHGCNLAYAQLIRKISGIPTAVVGGLVEPSLCESIIAAGKADFVAFGRQTFADHDYANKILAGQEEDISLCIRCFKCMRGNMEQLTVAGEKPPPQRCTVNPVHNMEPPPESYPTPQAPRNVLVVGGGVAGMEAAATAARRGHRVTLLEASGFFGGIVRYAERDAYKSDLGGFLRLLERRMRKAGVDIRLNTRATPELVRVMAPDALILATGSRPIVPPIEGIENALHCLEMYADMSRIGRNVVICGGGLVGCEAAVHLMKHGRKVTVIEMGEAVAQDSYPMHRVALMGMLGRGCTIVTEMRCTRISPNGVYAEDKNGNEKFFTADTVLFALGMRPNREDFEELRGAMPGGSQVYEIGDCVKPSKVFDAVEQGFIAAYNIT